MAVWHGEDRKLCANLAGYQNMYELPENIVACLLRDRWAQHRDVLYTTHDRACPWLRRTEVVINEKLKTSGGLTGQVLTSKWQHTYIPNNTYIHTYIHTYILTYLLTYLLTHSLTHSLTHLLTYLLTYLLTLLTYLLTYIHT